MGDPYVPALGFRSLTRWYDLVVGATTRERTFKRALIDQMNLRPGQRVLDLACGTGTLAVWMKQAAPGVEVTGVDGDPHILALARAKAGNTAVDVGFREAMSDALPFPDGHFDRVVSTLFFHHLSGAQKARTAAEVRRVLAAGGELHIADWGKARNLAMRILFLGIQALDGFGNTRDNVAGRLPQVFERAGFERVEETRDFSTVFGTMTLLCAHAPG